MGSCASSGSKVAAPVVQAPAKSMALVKRNLTPIEFKVDHGYQWTKSTAENYASDSDDFFGPFCDIRSNLDRSYHGNYELRRQKLQDTLVNDCISGGTSDRDHPWLVYTAGVMGAGKQHIFHWMSAKGHLPISDVIQIDADHFRTRLPEWPEHIKRSPGTAQTLTHRESGMLVEIAQEAAMRQGKHVWVDGSLKDSEWYSRLFDEVRHRHSKYRIAVLHVTAPEDIIQRRAKTKAEQTGRSVSFDDLQNCIKCVPASMNALLPKVDFLAVVSNGSHPVPKLVKLCDRTDSKLLYGDEWEAVRNKFSSPPPENGEHYSFLIDKLHTHALSRISEEDASLLSCTTDDHERTSRSLILSPIK